MNPLIPCILIALYVKVRRVQIQYGIRWGNTARCAPVSIPASINDQNYIFQYLKLNTKSHYKEIRMLTSSSILIEYFFVGIKCYASPTLCLLDPRNE